MNAKNKVIIFCSIIGIMIIFSGCRTTSGNVGQMQSFALPVAEEQWILNGEPIEFEGEWWYPQDGIESLQDSEVYLLGTYRDVQYFVDKIDVRPYDRLYTKFGKNKFRFFKKRKEQ